MIDKDHSDKNIKNEFDTSHVICECKAHLRRCMNTDMY